MTSTDAEYERRIRKLLEGNGQTYAERAGIRLGDKPAPLYQLLVLATLLSARISGDIAVAAARELFKAGYRTPARMRAASWQDRVDALGRGHYRRYDERTATMLGDGADLLIDQWRGDLRRLHDEASDDVGALARSLTRFPGIGPTGAAIFLREVQVVWTGISPYADARVRTRARCARLPSSPERLRSLVGSTAEFVRLEAAIVRR